MSKKNIQLEPSYLLDEKWKFSERISAPDSTLIATSTIKSDSKTSKEDESDIKVFSGLEITAGGDVTIGNVNGQVAVGRNISQKQIQVLSTTDLEVIRKTLLDIQKGLLKLDLPSDDQNIVNGDISAAIKESKKEKPELSKIKTRFENVVYTVKEAKKTIKYISELYEPARKIMTEFGIPPLGETVVKNVELEPENELENSRKKIIDLIRNTRIDIAEVAETKEISSKGKYDYLKSEIGMNIILPKGSISEMRFYVTLIAEGEAVAIDGFPKDVIEEKEILGGKIKVGISQAFKFIPVVGSYVGDLLDIQLNPLEFNLGSLKRVNIDFSGGLTAKPEWYFKENGIKNELRVALMIRKVKSVENIEGDVKAAWLYDPGFLKKVRVGSNERTIKIY